MLGVKTHLVIHHSLTRDSGTVSWSAIRRFHTSWSHEGTIISPAMALDYRKAGKRVRAPWRAIGYHAGIERVGGEFEFLLGRPILEAAAAAPQNGMNRRGVHVCFVGNFDTEPPPHEQLEAAAGHLAAWCEVLRIPLDAEHVIGHRDVNPGKSCPGKLFDLDQLRDLLEGAT